MVLYDRTIGSVLHAINTILFVYYTAWVVVTPFVDATHFTQAVFPPREYGILIPAVLIMLLLTVSLTVASVHIIRGPPAVLRSSKLVVEPAGAPAGLASGGAQPYAVQPATSHVYSKAP